MDGPFGCGGDAGQHSEDGEVEMDLAALSGDELEDWKYLWR